MNKLARFTIMAMFVAMALILLPFTRAQNPANPWTDAQTIQPAGLVEELAESKAAPTVLCVGFERLYAAGHIKGAEFHGSGGKAGGLQEIKGWAQSLSRSSNLVIYCGCCPMEKCPNIRPAFTALQEMGFTKVRVLILATSFEVDWVDKGLPYVKGK